MEVLQLDMSGRPQAWISAKEAAVLYASDGVAWTLVNSYRITMASNIYVGLAVASGSPGTPTISVFSNVTVVP